MRLWYNLIFVLVLSGVLCNNVSAQQCDGDVLYDFIITRLDDEQPIMGYGKSATDIGLIIYSNIKDLEIKVTSAVIGNVVNEYRYDDEKKAYILSLKPFKEESPKYTMEVNHPAYRSQKFRFTHDDLDKNCIIFKIDGTETFNEEIKELAKRIKTLEEQNTSGTVEPVKPRKVRRNVINWRYDNPLEPVKKNFNLRLLSTFNNKGAFGLGLNFSRSYFQFGFDCLFSHGFQIKSDLDVSNIHLTSEQDVINAYFYLLNETTTLASNGRPWKKESEYIYPRASVGISPGINLKYFSVECGLGIYFCENLNMTQYLLKTEGHDDIEGTNKVKSYFYIRPTIVGYIPLWDGYNGISVTMGYNFVPQAKVLNGFVFALGIFGEL